MESLLSIAKVGRRMSGSGTSNGRVVAFIWCHSGTGITRQPLKLEIRGSSPRGITNCRPLTVLLATGICEIHSRPHLLPLQPVLPKVA